MTYPKIGNEVDNLGATQMEADYRAHTWRCCWKRTWREIGLFLIALGVIVFITFNGPAV